LDLSSSCLSFIFLQSDASGAQLVACSVIMLILLLCSAMISGSEVAFFSLTPSDNQILEEQEDKTSERVLRLIRIPNRERASKQLLATILIANNFVNVGIVLLSTFVFDSLKHQYAPDMSSLAEIILNIGIVTFLIVLFGEVIPKIYASSFNVRLARFTALPLLVLSRLLKPLSVSLISTTRFVDRGFKSGDQNNISVDELEHAIELTQDEHRSTEEHKILEGIVNFGTKDVKQVMTNRMEVVAFSMDTPFQEILEEVKDRAHSRIPVYRNSLDEITGILYIKDLLPHLQKEEFVWQDILRTPFFVPENKKIDDLLREFQERKIHIAIVVDEYGGTSGLISLEDVIEEIVGDITDEFDDEELQYSMLDDSNYVFEGKTPLIDIYRILNISGNAYEAAKGEADTLAGFIIEQSGKIPLKGEKLIFEDLTFTIEAADKRKVKRVKITLNTFEDESSED
jgi:putative hemolysin